MSKIKIAQRFLSFLWQSDTIYDIHSPFVYDLAQAALEDHRHFYAFSMVEPFRELHLQNHHSIQVTDYGAGSQLANGKTRKISAIAKSALSSPFKARLLFRIVNHFKPKKMLELGTSLGVSSLYQMAASPHAEFITLEGCPNIAAQAQRIFDAYEDPVTINLKVGEFSQTLASSLQELQKVDYVFIDGNHRKAPTLRYFENCLQYAQDNSVFIFDDLHWSEEMQEAWTTIQKHPDVRLSVDFFFFGLVFFKKEIKIKQHFKIVPSNWKPWSMGFLGKK